MKIFTKNVKQLFFFFFLCTGLAIVSGCNKDDDKQEEPLTVAGYWLGTQNTTDDCGDQPVTGKVAVYEIKQTDDNLVVTSYPEERQYNGKIEGNNVSWASSYTTESGGTTTINFNGVISNTNSTSGSATWEWKSSSSSFSCSGTTTITATRVEVANVDFSGTWPGEWTTDDGDYEGTFTATVTQNGTTLSGTISVPGILAPNTTLKGTVKGNLVFFGDIENKVKFAGYVTNSDAKGSFVDIPNDYEGSWETTRAATP